MRVEYIRKSREQSGQAQIRLCIKAGTVQDVYGKEGTAHVLEHVNLLFDKLGMYGSRFNFIASGYTDFYNTTYIFRIDDEILYIYRVLEIINRILNGWFIEKFDINLAKKDIKEEIRKILPNPIVTKIIKNSELERKDPRNRKIDIDNINRDDIYQYYKKNYLRSNCLLLIKSGIEKREIDEGINLIISRNEEISVERNCFFLNWEKEKYEDSNNFNKIIFKVPKMVEQNKYNFWEAKWIQWMFELCFIKLFETKANEARVSEILFSPYEFLFSINGWNFDDCNDLIKKMLHVFRQYMKWISEDRFLQKFIDYSRERSLVDTIVLREKEYIYNRKLTLDKENSSFKVIKNLNIDKLRLQFENTLSTENILLLKCNSDK